MTSRRFLAVVAGLVLVVPLLAMSGPAGAQEPGVAARVGSKHCKANQVRLVVPLKHHRKQVSCIRRPGTSVAAQQKVNRKALRRALATVRLRPRHHGRVHGLPHPRRFRAIVNRLTSGPVWGHALATRAPLPAGQDRPSPTVTPGGTSSYDAGGGYVGQTSGTNATYDSSRGDSQDGYSSDASQTVSKGGGSGGLGIGTKFLMNPCPDTSGVDTGTATNLFTYEVRAPAGHGRIVTFKATNETVFHLTTHNNPDGTLRDFDIDFVWQWIAQAATWEGSHRVESAAPQFYTLSGSVHGLHPENAEDDFYKRLHLTSGRMPSAAEERHHVTDGFGAALALMMLTVPDSVKSFTSAWLAGKCLKVDLASTDFTLADRAAITDPGQRGQVRATVSPRLGARLSAGTWHVDQTRYGSGTSPGVSDPMTGTYPGPSTWSVSYRTPDDEWSRPEDQVLWTVRVASYQGRAGALITFKPKVGGVALRLATGSHLDITDPGEGTGSGDWIGSSRVPLTGDDQHLAGSAPYSWTTYQFQDNGVPMVCQAGGEGHEDIVSVKSDPGAASVTDSQVPQGYPGSIGDIVIHLRLAYPLEYTRTTFYPDATTCAASVTDDPPWASGGGVIAALQGQPGITGRYVTGSQYATYDYTITGWQASSDPDVIAEKRVHVATADDGRGPSTTDVVLQLVNTPATP